MRKPPVEGRGGPCARRPTRALVGALLGAGICTGCLSIAGLDGSFVLDDQVDQGGETSAAGHATSTHGGNGGGTAAGGSSAGGTSVTGGAGGAAAQGGVGGADCGNGELDGSERCDDENQTAHDGCTDCEIDPGFECSGEPSYCQPIEPQTVTTGPGLNLAIPCGAYDGSLGTMVCVDLVVPDNGHPAVHRVTVTVSITHPVASDLVVKLVSPAGTALSLLSRPGVMEPSDSTYNVDGDISNLAASAPISFADSSNDDAETMGNTIEDWETICQDDGRCEYRPNPGAGPGTNLADFQGEDPFGAWRVCVGDAFGCGSNGTLQAAAITLLSW